MLDNSTFEYLEQKGDAITIRLYLSLEEKIQKIMSETGLNRTNTINLLLKMAVKTL